MAIRRRPVQVVLLASACVVLAACGSQVPPSKFVAAQSSLYGAGNGGSNGSSNGGSNGAGANSNGGTIIAGTPGKPGTKSTVVSGSGGGGGSGAGGSGTGGGSNPGNAVAGITAASCAGFKNSTGISDSNITIANVADVSGPVPGLFAGVQQAMKAYVAYFNSTSSICGRKLSIESLDSQTSSSGDQQAAITSCGNAFAMVGSFGAFDAGGASTVTNCAIPDLRAGSTQAQRADSPVVFGTMSQNANYQPTAPADFYKSKFAGVAGKAAFLYLNAGAASEEAQQEIKGWTHEGFNFIYTAGIDVTAFNYTTYVSKMQSLGVQYVQFVGAYQYAVKLAQAIAQQSSFHPVFVLDPVAYDPGYVSSGGSAVNGTHIWINSETFEDASQIPEMQTYETWLQRVAPGVQPNYFGLYAWAAGALFTRSAIQLGGQLTRPALIAALKKVDSYTGNGLFGPQHVGAGITGNCYGFITLQNGTWVRESGQKFTCGSVTKVG